MSITWSNMTAAELGREIEKSHPLAPRIYARATPTRARGEAMGAYARAKSGQRRGLLDGVPISWKDLFDTADIATEAGSALLKGRIPSKDATVLTAATREGLVCLGKTHMSELAFSGLGLNPVTATSPCINDEQAVAGGSTSGGAASVAYGLAPAAIGSDTGGSVRIPAAWNDLVGLKTTSGRLSLTGTVPLCENFDTIGPLAHSVEDCALLLAAMENRKPADLTGASLSNARFAVLSTVAMDDLRPRPAQGFDDALSRISRAGASIEHIHIHELTEAMAIAGILTTAEAYGIWGPTIESAPDKMFPRILERFRAGATVKAHDYVASWRRLHQIRQIYAAKTAGYDAILIPTSPILPPNADRLMTDSAYYISENLAALRNTRIGNLMGLCALTLPTAEPSCGISLMAGPGQEDRLLRIGAAAERALR
jgi:aspartyl-tRNA(Asn)/glutamyl-tRNA(Gln) amidotransferase subunit A